MAYLNLCALIKGSKNRGRFYISRTISARRKLKDLMSPCHLCLGFSFPLTYMNQCQNELTFRISLDPFTAIIGSLWFILILVPLPHPLLVL